MTSATQTLDIGRVLTQTLSTMAAGAATFGALILAAGLIGGAMDTFVPRGGSAMGNIVFFLLNVLATRQALMTRLGGGVDLAPRFAAAFGASFLSGIGILVGVVLLVVPGLILMTRWALVLPALMAEQLGVSESLGRSWKLTAGNAWRILGIALILWVPLVLIMVLAAVLAAAFWGEGVTNGFAFNAATNILSSLIGVLTAVAWTEVYFILSGRTEGTDALADVFA